MTIEISGSLILGAFGFYNHIYYHYAYTCLCNLEAVKKHFGTVMAILEAAAQTSSCV